MESETSSIEVTLSYEVHNVSLASSTDSSEFTSCEVASSRLSGIHGDSGRTCNSDASTLVAVSEKDDLDASNEEAHNTEGEIQATSIPEVQRGKREELSEIEIMKERFARLLLGEDMSGGGKGVSSALAISNAITNLSASIFGNLWRLEPLAQNKRKMWKREMDWLLSVTNHIVELVPTWQSFPDGSSVEVMVANPRPDLQINLPALRKLDMMLLECLDTFKSPEFWYVDQEHMVCCKDKAPNRSVSRHEGKWWLPVPKVPSDGLSEESRKSLQHQKESTGQIFKAALAINAQIISEMEVPDVYLEGLPKNGKAILGEIYRTLTSEDFSSDAVLCTLDLSNEHNAVDFANRIEAAIHVWHHKLQTKQMQPLPKESKFNPRASWVIVKEFVADAEKREVLVERAERLMANLRQKFPGLPQTLLDMQKIQYNKDIGQSILESYSRVLESLAFNIIARIDAVLTADEFVRNSPYTSDSSQVVSSSGSQSSVPSSMSKPSTESPSLTKDSSRKSVGQKTLQLFAPGKTLADYMKLDPFTKRIYAAQMCEAGAGAAQGRNQWPCHLEQSPLGRD